MNQRKNYLSPATKVTEMAAELHLMAMSIGENTEVSVNVGEEHNAGDALVNENPFSFEWE